MSDPSIEQPTPEVERPDGGAAVPGASKGYGRLPTAPVPVERTEAAHPDAEQTSSVEWEPTTGAAPVDDARLAPWALVAAIVALAASMFVGWGIPVAIIAVIAAMMSLRRPIENRAVAIWALVLGSCATLFSAGWLLWAAMQLENLG
ncbi:hypothetical protein [Microbacterium sp. nov. GSS16]|uniref:hypothetical protein n=1 Tax=Microbacterium sp. nov. GSS16 TaxID=3019890 RepID=UPI0023059F00|nr:hypothetical protein [Microbacterium sp. nov. GSS16]WCD92835.1 hypothetical protein PGB26_00735 [Microbacterium sp. nov. GSS16]